MTSCQVCHNNKTTLYASFNSANLVECLECGFIWLNPLPSSEELAILYNNAYNNNSESYFTKIDKKIHRSRKRAKKLRKIFPKKSLPNFLDIGCNGGFMVEAARKCGFNSSGVELDPESFRYAVNNYPKNSFFLGNIESFLNENPTKKFEMIYCSEVIEHVLDINSFVQSISKILNNNGYLYITTPNIRHWRRPSNLTDWDGFCPPAHCQYFDTNTLKIILEKFKLRIVKKYVALKPGIKFLAKKE